MTATSDDASSTFSYDGEGVSDTFSLSELRRTVNSHFNAICTIEKLAKGGYHKVYIPCPFVVSNINGFSGLRYF